MNIESMCGETVVRRPGPPRGAIGGHRLFWFLFVAMTKRNKRLFDKEGKLCIGDLYLLTLYCILWD
jgi:hypothetical protein